MQYNFLGTTNLQQLAENIDSAKIKLDRKIIESINAIHRLQSSPSP